MEACVIDNTQTKIKRDAMHCTLYLMICKPKTNRASRAVTAFDHWLAVLCLRSEAHVLPETYDVIVLRSGGLSETTLIGYLDVTHRAVSWC